MNEKGGTAESKTAPSYVFSRNQSRLTGPAFDALICCQAGTPPRALAELDPVFDGSYTKIWPTTRCGVVILPPRNVRFSNAPRDLWRVFRSDAMRPYVASQTSAMCSSVQLQGPASCILTHVLVPRSSRAMSNPPACLPPPGTRQHN